MCDFICVENIRSLIYYIVSKHLSKPAPPSSLSDDGNLECNSLELLANPYVDSFKQLRKAFEGNNASLEHGDRGACAEGLPHDSETNDINGNHEGLLLMNGRGRFILNKKALEDQVRDTSASPSSFMAPLIRHLLFLSNCVDFPTLHHSLLRKFCEVDEEESYFNEEENDTVAIGAAAVAQSSEQKLHPMRPDNEGSTSLMEDVNSLNQ